MRHWLAGAWLLLLTVLAQAQPATVIGPVTPGHCASFFSTTQIQDCGSIPLTLLPPTTNGDFACFTAVTGQITDCGVSPGAVRQKLLGPFTYYVNSNAGPSPCGAFTCGPGSDSNNGTAATPFATLQKACNSAAAWDFNNNNLFIQPADGNYVSGQPLGGGGCTNSGAFVGGAGPIIVGDNRSLSLSSLSAASCAVATFSVAQAAPLVVGSTVIFSGTMPTGVTAGQPYFVISAGNSTAQFEFSTFQGGPCVASSGSTSNAASVQPFMDYVTVQSPSVAQAFLVQGGAVFSVSWLKITGNYAGGAIGAGSIINFSDIDLATLNYQTFSQNTGVINFTVANAITAPSSQFLWAGNGIGFGSLSGILTFGYCTGAGCGTGSGTGTAFNPAILFPVLLSYFKATSANIIVTGNVAGVTGPGCNVQSNSVLQTNNPNSCAPLPAPYLSSSGGQID